RIDDGDVECVEQSRLRRGGRHESRREEEYERDAHESRSVHELLTATSVPLSCESVVSPQEIRAVRDRGTRRHRSMCAFAHSSRNDIVAVKNKLDEKQHDRFRHELLSRVTPSDPPQFRSRIELAARSCRLRIAAGDRKRLRGTPAVCTLSPHVI